MAPSKIFKEKPKCFVIFADLDGTFTPMDLPGKIDFVNVIKEIMEKCKVKVKFVPVSGRPSGYVLRILHDCRDMLKGEGLDDVCEFGAAEQGALIVDSSRSYGPKFTGRPENVGLKRKVNEILDKNKFRHIISDEPDKLYTCSIHIKNEAKAKMSHQEQHEVYLSVKTDIELQIDPTNLSIAMSHNCMEVMTKEISKEFAMNQILYLYSKQFNIVGLTYAGDAENDKIAMMYTSRLAEVPGVNAHNFTPSNAQEAISSKMIEPWKYRHPTIYTHFVEKGTQKLFRGIAELIRKAINENRLCGPGVTMWTTRDDHDLAVKENRNGCKNGKIRRFNSFKELRQINSVC